MGDPAARKALIESALYDSPVLHQLQWDGAAVHCAAGAPAGLPGDPTS